MTLLGTTVWFVTLFDGIVDALPEAGGTADPLLEAFALGIEALLGAPTPKAVALEGRGAGPTIGAVLFSSAESMLRTEANELCKVATVLSRVATLSLSCEISSS